jgi:hypothetical protein
MNTIETTTQDNEIATTEESLRAPEATLTKEESFRVYRDEMSRLLLSDYVESTLAHWDVWV